MECGLGAALGVIKADRVATISPNTHQQLEQFYAVPQLGAVLVPINYRLSAEDFVYVVTHSGSKVLCVHGDYLDAIDAVRHRMPDVQHFVALEGRKNGWLDYESLLEDADWPKVAIEENDLIAINYTSGTTSRPKGVMITHRNAWMNSIGTLVHWPMTPASRYLWTLPMFHANGWTFTWTVTAAGGVHTSACVRVDACAEVYRARSSRKRVTHSDARRRPCSFRLRMGPKSLSRTVAAQACASRCSRPVLRRPPPRSSGMEAGSRVGQSPMFTVSRRPRRSFRFCESLPEHAGLSIRGPSGRSSKSRQGVELVITSGELRVVDEEMRDVPQDGATLGEIIARGNVVMARLFQ